MRVLAVAGSAALILGAATVAAEAQGRSAGGPPGGMPAAASGGMGGTMAGGAAAPRGPGMSSGMPGSRASLPSQGLAGQANRPVDPWTNARPSPLPPLSSEGPGAPEFARIPAGDAAISDTAVERIRAYYVQRGQAPTTIPVATGRPEFLPPDNPPPGITNHWQIGKQLPPGIQARFLPADLLDEIVTRPGTKYVLIDGDVVLVADDGTVLDAVPDVVPGG